MPAQLPRRAGYAGQERQHHARRRGARARLLRRPRRVLVQLARLRHLAAAARAVPDRMPRE
eukprot:scaffold15150_cov32-Tisochrysis_lutea.AAC.2